MNPYQQSDSTDSTTDEIKQERSVLDQLEDAVLKFVPAIGAVFGGPVLITASGRRIDGLIAFMLGGALGALFIYLLLLAVFYALNPGRDRRHQNRM